MAPAGVLLASTNSSTRTVFQLRVDEIGIALGLAFLLACAVVVYARRERPPEPGPSTLETPPQSPAVAALLTHTREVPGEAAAATLIDLAARGVLEITEMGGGTPGVRLTRRPLPELTAYEQRVIDLVREHVDASGVAPAAALAHTDEKKSAAWLKSLRNEVRTEARKAGWVRSRYGREVAALALLLVGAGAAVVIWAFATATTYNRYRPHPPVPQEGLRDALSLVALGLGVAALIAVGSLWASSAQRLTRTGRPIAAAWLGVAEHLRDDEQLADAPPNSVAVWHRLLAYATGFGVARRVQSQLPLGPESPTRAWSAESGRWRIVRVRYPKRWPPGWGTRPGELIKLGLTTLLQVGIPIAVIVGLGSKLLADGIMHDVHIPLWGYALAVVMVVPFLIAGVLAAVQLLVGIATLFALFGPPRVVTGRAIRVRPVGESAVTRWVAVDDGTKDEVRAYLVRVPNTIRQDDHVRLTVRPVTGEVREVAVRAANTSATQAPATGTTA